MKFFNKKITIFTFIALILFLVAPKITLASVPVFETNPVLVDVQTGTQLANTFDQWFIYLAKLAAEALKRQLLNEIVDQIVTFIQGGGTPKFITDWPGFFRDAVDQAGGQFLGQLGLDLFCSPLNLTLRAAFIPIPKFSDRSSCTLSQVGANLENFLTNFNEGGWPAWLKVVVEPQNNIYGAYLTTWDQYEIEKSAAQKAAESEAQAGRGFLGVRKCLEEVTDEDGQTRCAQSQIITPGAAIGDVVSKAIGSDIDYIVNAQDFEAYVAAIANAILNRIFAEGVGLLNSGLSQ